MVAAWRASGQTRSAFSRAHGFHPKSLGRWISEVSAAAEVSGAVGGAGFVPATAPTQADTVRWELPGDLGVVTAAMPADLAAVLAGVLMGSAR